MVLWSLGCIPAVAVENLGRFNRDKGQTLDESGRRLDYSQIMKGAGTDTLRSFSCSEYRDRLKLMSVASADIATRRVLFSSAK